MISERISLIFTGFTWGMVAVVLLWTWYRLERPATGMIWFGAMSFMALGGYWATRGLIFPSIIPTTGVIVNMVAAGWLITAMSIMTLKERGSNRD